MHILSVIIILLKDMVNNMRDLKRISIIWGLLLFAIFAVLTFFALKWKFKNEPYFKLEELIVSKTKSSFEMNHSYPNRDNYVIVPASELKANGMIDELKVENDECDGYVKVYNNGVMEYTGYIKCNNYTSKDYDKYMNSSK